VVSILSCGYVNVSCGYVNAFTARENDRDEAARPAREQHDE
jgi:hypothetical protein